jgi:hypothetical protein
MGKFIFCWVGDRGGDWVAWTAFATLTAARFPIGFLEMDARLVGVSMVYNLNQLHM